MDTHDLVVRLLDTAALVTKRLDRSLSSIKGISFSEYQLLAALAGAPGSAASRIDLAGRVGLTASGVTRALKPLEKLGFVETHKDERDARRAVTRLTPAGEELVDDAGGVVADVLDGLGGLGTLTADERELLGSVLDGLAR